MSKFPLSLAAAVVLGLSALPIAPHAAPVEAAGYNGKILIASNRDGNDEIYVVDGDGINPVNLSNNPASDGGSRWSPDGSKIAFSSNRSGNYEIYIMDADGSNVIQLTDDPASDRNPYWSPSGSKIGFESTRSGVNPRQWYMNADGTDPTCITCDWIAPVVAGHHNASWSPLGDRIAFQINGTGGGIFTIRLDGTDPIQLSTVGIGNSADQSPAWSPDGLNIVFMSPRSASSLDNEFYRIRADGTNEVRLTNNAFYENAAVVSPDGTKIGFTRADDIVGNSGSRDPWIMNADGSGATRLFQSGFTDWMNGWQPIPNTSPVLAAKSLTLQAGTTSSIDVLSGSTDEEDLEIANLAISAGPTHGSAAIVDGKVSYTPTAGYVGEDELTYEVCDSFMLDQKCSTAVLGITVSAGPPPTLSVSSIGGESASGNANLVTSNRRPVFSGVTSPFAVVTVEIHSDPIILETTADGEGNWSVTPQTDLPLGEHTVYISATLNGSTTELDSFVLGIEALPMTGSSEIPVRAAGTTLLTAGAIGAFTRRFALH